MMMIYRHAHMALESFNPSMLASPILSDRHACFHPHMPRQCYDLLLHYSACLKSIVQKDDRSVDKRTKQWETLKIRIERTARFTKRHGVQYSIVNNFKNI